MSLASIANHLNHRQNRILPRFSLITKLFFFAITLFSLAFLFQTVQAQEFSPVGQWAQDVKLVGRENWLNGALIDNIMASNNIFIDVENQSLAFFEGKEPWKTGGLLGGSTKIIAALYKPQISGVQYIAQSFDGFLGKPAYAQGVGFQGLLPLLDLWRGFRNVVYTLSSIIFIAIGIMIILQVKISPQAIITVQNAIPRLITTLILVTFSYAIAGLLIDLILFIQSLAIMALFSAVGKDPSIPLFKPDAIASIINWLNDQLGTNNPNLYSFSDLNQGSFLKIFALINLALPQTTIVLLSGLIGAIVTIATGGNFGFGLGVAAVVLLVFNVIVLIFVLKFLFGVAKAYINVLLKVILAPFEIGIGAIPIIGSSKGFGSWMKGLIANLSVFPISLLFLIILNIIVDTQRNFSGLWAPPMIGGTGEIIKAIIGIGGIAMFSSLPKLIPEAIYAIKPSPFAESMMKPEGIPIIGSQYKAWKDGGEKRRAENFSRYQSNIGDMTVGPHVEEVRNRAISRGREHSIIWPGRTTSEPIVPPPTDDSVGPS